MSVLRDFEHRLEGVVEGLFAKTFRSGLQPVELAKRILRDMDAGRTVGVDGSTWVPNRYVFSLSPEDHQHLASAENAMVAELGQVVIGGAQERNWGLVGPPQIVIEESGAVKRGQFRCAASLAEGGPGEGPVLPASAELNILEGGRRTRSIPLNKPVITLGRLGECDVVLGDSAASRRHAEIRNLGGGSFAAVDLHSTNGTLVNDVRIEERPLHDGDRITIGQTQLEFRKL